MDTRLRDDFSSPQDCVPAEVVVFDAPGVLYDDSMWHRWLFRLLQRVGLQADFQMFSCVWDEEFVGEIAAGRAEYWDSLRRYLQELGLRRGCIDEVLVAARSRKRSLQQPTCPLNGVKQTIMELFGRGFQLAAVGDRGDAPRLGDLLGTWQLHRYFSFVEDSAARSPDDVCQQLRQTYGERDGLVVISNSIWMLRQAAKANLRTIAFDARGRVLAPESDIRKLGRSLVPASPRRAAG